MIMSDDNTWPGEEPIPDPMIDPHKNYFRGGRIGIRGNSNIYRDQGNRQRCPDGSPLPIGGVCPPQRGGY